MPAWTKRESALPMVEGSKSERWTIVAFYNSNGLRNGDGHDYGCQQALYARRNMWATGLVNVNHSGGDNQGYKWSVGLHPSLTLPKNASPLSAHTSKQADTAQIKQTGYTYFADATTSDWTQAYAVVSLDADCPINVNANLRLHIYGGEFASGSGAMYPAWRNSAGSPRTELASINPVTGTDQMATWTRDIAAATRNYAMQIGFKCPGFTANVHNGPIFVGNQRVENTDRSAGLSWMTRISFGGQPLRVIINQWLALTNDQKDYLLGLDRALNNGGGVCYKLHEGLNARNDTTNSVGPSPAASDTRNGYADNCRAFINDIEARYDANGWSKAKLLFWLSVDHPVSTPDDAKLIAFRGAIADVANSRPRVFAGDIEALITGAQISAAGYYASGGADTDHLTLSGYVAVDELIVASLFAPFESSGSAEEEAEVLMLIGGNR